MRCVTGVWMTAGGERYHRVPDCPGIVGGHAKAAAEGLPNHPPVLTDLAAARRTVYPCAVCWGDALAEDRWLRKVLDTEAQTETDYELRFLVEVLQRVPGLNPDHVHAQREVCASSGRSYRLDFSIEQPDAAPIALEVDGYEKTSRGNEMTPQARGRANARRNDLSAEGWRVLHFSNSDVATDPGRCRQQIERMLVRDRAGRVAPAAAEPLSRPAAAGTTAGTASAHEDAPGRSNRLAWLMLLTLVAGVAVFGVGVWLSSDLEPTQSEPVEPSGHGECPSTHPVKGNRSTSGDWIYHRPGWVYYDRTAAEECFGTDAEARDAGYRASEVR